MRSKSATVLFHQTLWDSRKELQKATGAKSVNAMQNGLMLYAFLHGGEHPITNAIFELPVEVQDELIDAIVANFKAGKSGKGSWLAHRIDDAVKKLADGQTIDPKDIVSQLLKDIREKK